MKFCMNVVQILVKEKLATLTMHVIQLRHAYGSALQTPARVLRFVLYVQLRLERACTNGM